MATVTPIESSFSGFIIKARNVALENDYLSFEEVHFNVLGNVRPDISLKLEGSLFDPFCNPDCKIVDILTEIKREW